MKKTKIVALATAMAISAGAVFASVSTAVAAPILGDVDESGKVMAKDARIVLRHVARLETLEDRLLPTADVNGDGKVNMKDARLILRYAARLENKMGGEEKYDEITRENGSETTKVNPGDLSTKPNTRPGTTKPDTTKPDTTKPDITKPETTTEPEETTKDPLADIPQDIKTFASAKFTFTGTVYGGDGAQAVSLTTSGDNLKMAMNMDGIKLNFMKRMEKKPLSKKEETKYYLISEEKKLYTEFNADALKLIGLDLNMDDLNFSFKAIDLSAQTFTVEENVAFNGKSATCYTLSDGESMMKFYTEGDKLVGLVTYDAAGNEQQMIVFKTFSGDVPDSVWSLDPYKKVVGFINFFVKIGFDVNS